MKKSIIFFALLGVCVSGYSQTTTRRLPNNSSGSSMQRTEPLSNRPADRLYFGGNLGLTFGSYTRIALNPMVGYWLSPKFSPGLRINYEYIRDNRYANLGYSAITASNYGASLFGRYRFIPQAYAHAEFAYNGYKGYFIPNSNELTRVWVPFLFLGGGYVQPIGGRTAFMIEVLFDVLNDANSPYPNWQPFISMGVGVGF